MALTKLSRRDFLRLTGVSGGSLLIAMNTPLRAAQLIGEKSQQFSPSAWLQITDCWKNYYLEQNC